MSGQLHLSSWASHLTLIYIFTSLSNRSSQEHKYIYIYIYIYKLYCSNSNLNVRSNFLSQRCITAWKSLSNDVVTSLFIFNSKLYNVNFYKFLIFYVFTFYRFIITKHCIMLILFYTVVRIFMLMFYYFMHFFSSTLRWPCMIWLFYFYLLLIVNVPNK